MIYSKKFLKFIEIWQEDFAIARSMDEKVCVDKKGNPLPWYTYPAIEYLSQFDYSDKKIFEFGCGYSSPFWAERAAEVVSVEDNPIWFGRWQAEFDNPNLEIRLREEGEIYEDAILENDSLYDVIVVDAVKKSISISITVDVDIDQLNPFSRTEKNDIALMVKSAVQLFVDGGFRGDGSYYPGLSIGEDFIPHKLAVFLDNEVKELQDVHFNYPLNHVSISDEEIASTGNVTVDVI